LGNRGLKVIISPSSLLALMDSVFAANQSLPFKRISTNHDFPGKQGLCLEITLELVLPRNFDYIKPRNYYKRLNSSLFKRVFKKKTPISVVTICVFFLIMLMPEIPMVEGYSVTNQLHRNGGGGFILCELQPGDHIAASFSLSNMGPYTETWPEDPDFIVTLDAFYSINISFGLPGNDILNFANIKGDSFEYTAVKSGRYTISHLCESDNGLLDAKDPIITINYYIIKAKTPTPLTPTPTIQPPASSTIQPTLSSEIQSEPSSAVYIVGFLGALLLAITVSILLLFRRKAKANIQLSKD
jgi:hypothetical protein